MGLRGPSPKPTALRLLEGNPAKRPLPKDEPQPREVCPQCPEHIRSDAEAYKTWEYYVPILLRMRVLTEADGMILANLCLTHSNLVANLNHVRTLNSGSKSGMAGVVIATKTGYLAPNQFYLNVQAAINQETQLCRELGLTPAARTRIQVADQNKSERPGSTLNGNWADEA